MKNSVLSTEEKHRIVEKYFDMIYRLAFAQVKSGEYADEVVQEVFLRFLRSDKAFESDEHIKAWLIRVAINCGHNIFSNSWYKKTVPLVENEIDSVVDMEEKSDIYYAIKELPQKYSAVIHLFYYEDMSIEDISKYLKLNLSTVKSQLSRGRKILRKKLEGGIDFV